MESFCGGYIGAIGANEMRNVGISALGLRKIAPSPAGGLIGQASRACRRLREEFRRINLQIAAAAPNALQNSGKSLSYGGFGAMDLGKGYEEIVSTPELL